VALKALVDADLILYRVGFTTEDIDESDIVANRIDGLVQDTIINAIGADDYCLYFTDGKNFRFDVYDKYKESRKNKPKPRHYDWIKAYLKENYIWESDPYYEADDLLGINQTEDTVICSIDKDLLQIKGHHFNFVNGQHNFVTPEQGHLWFCKQLLMGDNTDDIPGVPLITKHGISNRLCFGEKTCSKYLDGREDPLQEVVNIYKKVYKDQDWNKEINLRGSLVHIRTDYITDATPVWNYHE